MNCRNDSDFFQLPRKISVEFTSAYWPQFNEPDNRESSRKQTIWKVSHSPINTKQAQV